MPRRAIHTIILALLAGAAPGVTAQTIWTGADGDWFVDGNWSAGVPTGSNDARINAGTAAIDASGALAHSVFLGYDLPDSGVLEVGATGALGVVADLAVGYGGTGAMHLSGGARVDDYSGEIGYSIDSATGASGAVTVDGAGTVWNNAYELYVGYGTGTLSITGGGAVGGAYGYVGYYPESPGRSSGTVTIDGDGSNWTLSSSLHVGDSGTGVLDLANGGRAVSGESHLGFDFGSDGTAHIDGAGSSWTSNGFFYVGNDGNGTLEVVHGGRMESNGSYAYFAWHSASIGTATIDGAGSTWANANGLYVGFGGSGSLTISDGGTMTTGAFANVGFSPGASGALVVTGAGSSFVAGGTIAVGGNVSGPGGNGTVRVEDGGSIEAAIVNVWNTGTLSLSGGTLAAPVYVAEGGSLSGFGTLGGDGDTIDIDGALAADAGAALGVGGSLVIGASATTHLAVSAGGGATIVVAHGATLGGTLDIEVGNDVAEGAQFVLVDADGGLGGSEFANAVFHLPPDSDLSPTIVYDANRAVLTFAQGGAADIAVTIAADRNYASAGEIVDYIVTVQNPGALDASGISISTELSSQLDIASATWTCLGPVQSGCTPAGTGNIADSALTVPAGGSVSYRIGASVLDDVGDDAIETRAHVDLAGDPNPANDDASATTTLVLFRNGFDAIEP